MRYEWKGWLRLGVTLFILYLAVHYWSPFCHLMALVLCQSAGHSLPHHPDDYS